jgi:hypothetical protein
VVGGVVVFRVLGVVGGVGAVHYPEDTGGGHSRYRLHQVGKQADGAVAYAVYGAPDMADDEVARIADERAYARRFEAEPEVFTH